METATSSITVVIADDHELTRTGIRATLQAAPDITLVGEATDGFEAQQLIERLKPHVAILDLIMPGLSPVDITRWAYEHHPETAILVLTAHDRDYYLAQMLQAGAAGYLDKNKRSQELVNAIRRAAEGQALFTQEQRRRAQEWQTNIQDTWERLTTREQDILRLLADGLSNREIAERLQISENTVGKHVSHILTAIGAASRTEAAIWLRESGLEWR